MNNWTYPRTPGGGGFSTTIFSLSFLFEQYMLRKNIWTASNIGYDLCRYIKSRFYFYRHPWADFVVKYTLMYPMTLNFQDYMNTQPLQMLLAQHKFVVPSLKYKPHGKPYVKKTFKPPKQMTNKWFFQDSFSEKPLVLIQASVCNLKMPFLGPMGENELITLDCLNIQTAYIDGNWGQGSASSPYNPLTTYSQTNTQYTKGSQTKDFALLTSRINYTGGWFSKELLTADTIKTTNSNNFYPPTYKVRYNPKEDTGHNNSVWLCSIMTERYNKPTSDKILLAREQPLWILLYGFVDYIIQLKKGTETEKIYYLLIETDYFRPTQTGTLSKTHLILDSSFINGRGPYDSQVTTYMTTHWYPTLEHQQKSISNIVCTGPFTNKPEPTKGNWELHYKYSFLFKWGGAQDTTKQVSDPTKKQEYPTPDTVQLPIQIADPKTQIPETILHTWDYRRDYITKTALKRMSEHLPTPSIISTDSECHSPPKRQKLSAQLPHLQEESTKEISYLQELFKENTCQDFQEEKEDPLRVLIHQQQQQQQQIKQNLLLLLTDIKQKQRQLQLHSGLLE